MKKFLVITLILTLIFPAHCFSYPKEAILVKEELKKIPINEELIDEIMLILEDGVVEQEEIESLMRFIEEGSISPSMSCVDALIVFVSVLVFAIFWIDIGGNDEFLILLFNVATLLVIVSCLPIL